MKFVRQEKRDTAAGVGLPVRGETQPSGKKEGSEEEKEKRVSHKQEKAQFRKMQIKVTINASAQL